MKMIFPKVGLIFAALFFGVLPSAAFEGVIVIVNEDVPVSNLGVDALKDIYIAKTAYWNGGQRIVIVVLADKTDAAVKEVSGMDASQFKTFWQRLAFSGRGKQPEKVNDAASLVALVASTKGAIALVPADTVLKGVKKLEVK
jgi:ABC-type phosphate transport system substrate-binding protein